MRHRSLLITAQAGADQDGTCKPQLTSLIDVMTILLVFLIHNFSAEGAIVAAPKDCALPVSTARERPEMITTVTITPVSILVNGALVAPLSAIGPQTELMVEPLYRCLRIPGVGIGAGTAAPSDETRLMIQSDKSIAFSYIKKVMYTCSKAGYTDFTVMVMNQG